MTQKSLVQQFVLPVYIGEEVRFIIFHDDGTVCQNNRNWLAKCHCIRFSGFHCRFNAFRRPFGLVDQNKLCQLDGFLYTNTAVTEIATGPVKQPD